MYFVPFRRAPAAKVLDPITHNPENMNAPTTKYRQFSKQYTTIDSDKTEKLYIFFYQNTSLISPTSSYIYTI